MSKKLIPIWKWNSGLLATLCHKCRTIITIGHTDDLYCWKHKPKLEDDKNKT